MAHAKMPPPQSRQHGPPLVSTHGSLTSPWTVSPGVCLLQAVSKIPKTAENFHALSTREKRFSNKNPRFTGFFQDFRAKVVISRAIVALAASRSMGRKLMMRISSEAHGSWQLIYGKCWTQHKRFPVFMSTAKTEWLDGKHVVFGKVREGRNIVEELWVQEWRDQQEDHHCRLWTNLINLTPVLS